MILAGGCFCGKVRYKASGEVSDASVCHCAICRRTTGAPAVAWFSVAPDAFGFTAGEPKAFRSSDAGVRRFCADCGAQLTFQDRRAPVIDVTIASLDDPEVVAPVDNIWTTSRLGWMTRLHTLPDLARGHRSDLPLPAESIS